MAKSSKKRTKKVASPRKQSKGPAGSSEAAKHVDSLQHLHRLQGVLLRQLESEVQGP